MIIFTDRTGQLSNQLFEFSTFIANSLENDSRLVNLFFTDYQEYFRGPAEQHHLIRTSFGKPYIDKFLRKLVQYPWVRGLFSLFNGFIRGDGNTPQDIHAVNSKGIILLKEGAWFTDFENFYKYEKELKAYFTPTHKYTDRINNFISDCRTNHEILVGIHIRKGDYKEFLGGQFYFEQEVYRDKALQAARLFPGKKVGFIICSNEAVNLADFSPLTAYTGLGHFIEDLYTLAQCDYIMGPPSTFTMWASFYGNKPLLKIRNTDQVIHKEDFKIDSAY